MKGNEHAIVISSARKIMAEQIQWTMIFLEEKREDDDHINIRKRVTDDNS